MSSYIKVPNMIFDIGLKQQELNLYVYLLGVKDIDKGEDVYIKLKTMADNLNYANLNSVSRLLNKLQKAGLLKINKNTYKGKITTSSYNITEIPLEYGFFIIKRKEFKKIIHSCSKSTTAIFIFLERMKNSDNKCFPSYTQIQKVFRCGRTTVNKALKELYFVFNLLIFNQIKKDTSFGHNLYDLTSLFKVRHTNETNVKDGVENEISINKNVNYTAPMSKFKRFKGIAKSIYKGVVQKMTNLLVHIYLTLKN